MPLPTSPNIVADACIDTPSVQGTCVYDGQPLGPAGIFVSPNVFVKGAPLKFYHSATVPDTITGKPNNPLVPCVVPVARRKTLNTLNTSVTINKFLPLIQGDVTVVLEKKRPLLGPVQYPTLLICSKELGEDSEGSEGS